MILENYINELFDNQDIVDIARTTSCKEADQCNISDYLLLELSGGIPIKEIKYLRLEITVINSCVYDVEVTTDHYSTLRTINFQTREIYNYLMIVVNQKCGIGTNLFLNQVIAAKKYSFNEVITSANAGTYNGFYTWGRLGYTMSQDHNDKLQMWCIERNIEPMPIFELLLNPEYKSLWLNAGFTWEASFSLEIESENFTLLKRYLEEKGRLDRFLELIQ